MKKRIIMNIQQANEYLSEFMYKSYGWRLKYAIPENYRRHYTLIFFDHLSIDHKIYLIYQRKWFMSMDKYFNVNEQAVTINRSILNYVISSNHDLIIWINLNGDIYSINPLIAKKLANKNKWTRITEKTHEHVVHIPLSRLTKLF